MSIKRVEVYRSMLEQLDADYQKDVESREQPTGTQAEVYAEVGRRAVADREYQNQRQQYLQAINDEEEVSPGVANFLKKDETVSKFDVDSGKAKPDNSLNPLGGKQI